MLDPYRDMIHTITIKEKLYVFNQQTARGSAQRGEHDGPVYQIGKGEIDDTLKQGIATASPHASLSK